MYKPFTKGKYHNDLQKTLLNVSYQDVFDDGIYIAHISLTHHAACGGRGADNNTTSLMSITEIYFLIHSCKSFITVSCNQ